MDLVGMRRIEYVTLWPSCVCKPFVEARNPMQSHPDIYVEVYAAAADDDTSLLSLLQAQEEPRDQEVPSGDPYCPLCIMLRIVTNTYGCSGISAVVVFTHASYAASAFIRGVKGGNATRGHYRCYVRDVMTSQIVEYDDDSCRCYS